MFGVNGGVTQSSGHAVSPVSAAISGGKGRGTPKPSCGKVKDVCSVGASSNAVISAAKAAKRKTERQNIYNVSLRDQ